tara:strand:- start:79 stop:729 length:651 start_codon:yes stop_codon:yes gene_type:complete
MVNELINECKKTLQDNLVSVIRFGTEGEKNNILIVTKTLKFRDLEKIKPIINKYSKRTKIIPVLFTENGLKDGSDVFPLEFLDIKYPHHVLFGKKVLEEVKFEKKHVRRQLEFELRSKLIHLRENYLWIKKSKDLKTLLKSAIPSVMPLFYGLLFLKDINPPTELYPLFRKVQDIYGVDTSLFRKIRQDKFDEESVVSELMELLETLINLVDKLEV